MAATMKGAISHILLLQEGLEFFLQIVLHICRIEKCVSMPWERTFSIFVILVDPATQTATTDS